METAIAEAALKIIAQNPNILKSISMPNIPFLTMGGAVFWNEIANYKGWRVQQNMITQHARILNPDNVRVAWGGIDAMTQTLNRIVEGHKY